MGGDTWYEKQKQTVLVLSDSSLLSILFSTSLWHVRFRGPDIQSFGCPSLGKLFPIDSALCWTIEWLGCNEMAANGCRFSDFAFLRLFKCLFWAYLCLLAGFLCLCSHSFLRRLYGEPFCCIESIESNSQIRMSGFLLHFSLHDWLEILGRWCYAIHDWETLMFTIGEEIAIQSIGKNWGTSYW